MIKLVNVQLKKSLQTYQGLRLFLDLPVRGQRTRTNASTQRLLARNPRKRHFVQK
jgi:ribosomal protein S13